MHLSFVLLKSTLCLALITALLDTAVGVPIPQFGPGFKEAFQQAARDPNSGVEYNRFTGNHYTHNGRTFNGDPRTASSSGRQRTTDDYSGQSGPNFQGPNVVNSFQTTTEEISGQYNRDGVWQNGVRVGPQVPRPPRPSQRRHSSDDRYPNSQSDNSGQQTRDPNAGRRSDDGGYRNPRRQDSYPQRRPTSDSGIPSGRSGGEPTAQTYGPNRIDVLKASNARTQGGSNPPSRPQQQDAGAPRTQPQSGSNPPSRQQQPYAGDAGGAGRPSANAKQADTRGPAPPVSRPVPTRKSSVGASGNPAPTSGSASQGSAAPSAGASRPAAPKTPPVAPAAPAPQSAEECANATPEQRKSNAFQRICGIFKTRK